jgi:hypothetical protein
MSGVGAIKATRASAAQHVQSGVKGPGRGGEWPLSSRSNRLVRQEWPGHNEASEVGRRAAQNELGTASRSEPNSGIPCQVEWSVEIS